MYYFLIARASHLGKKSVSETRFLRSSWPGGWAKMQTLYILKQNQRPPLTIFTIGASDDNMKRVSRGEVRLRDRSELRMGSREPSRVTRRGGGSLCLWRRVHVDAATDQNRSAAPAGRGPSGILHPGPHGWPDSGYGVTTGTLGWETVQI